jgi:hypothetical protein
MRDEPEKAFNFVELFSDSSLIPALILFFHAHTPGIVAAHAGHLPSRDTFICLMM